MTIETEQRRNAGSQSYATELGTYNVAEATTGELRPYEQKLMQTLEKIGSKRLRKRQKEAQRLLRENGATHNVFDAGETPRSWQFDPIPLIIDSNEWGQIEQGLAQRGAPAAGSLEWLGLRGRWDVPAVYITTAVLLVLLYPLCRWYRTYGP